MSTTKWHPDQEKKGVFVLLSMKQKISWKCNNVLGISTGRFFQINHHFLNVGKVNAVPEITTSNILPWLITQTVAQNTDSRGLWRNLLWYYFRSVAGGLILVWQSWATYGTIQFISFSYHFLGVIFQMVCIS